MEPISCWVRPEVLVLHRAVSDRTGHASQARRVARPDLTRPSGVAQQGEHRPGTLRVYCQLGNRVCGHVFNPTGSKRVLLQRSASGRPRQPDEVALSAFTVRHDLELPRELKIIGVTL
jgi:hypothetical protein